jgi:hypothetical protein
VLGLAEFFGLLPICWSGSLQAWNKVYKVVHVPEFFVILPIFTRIVFDKVYSNVTSGGQGGHKM